MKNKNILNFIIIIIVTILVLYFSLKDNFQEIVNNIFAHFCVGKEDKINRRHI